MRYLCESRVPLQHLSASAGQEPPDYLVIGHVTRDLLPSSTSIPGGTALYAAMTARRLGCRVATLTAAADLPASLAATGEIVCLPSQETSTFINRSVEQVRRQWVSAVARPLDLTMVPEHWFNAAVVHLGPVLHECAPDIIAAFPHALIGVTPQGWLRHWNDRLPSPITPRRWQPDPAFLRRVDALILSSEDVDDPTVVASYARFCKLVAHTHGAAGVTLYVHGQPRHIPAYPVTEIDPTGAGDVFAAALLVYLYETGDPLHAARFAAVAAAVAVEGAGTSCIPGRAEVLDRLHTGYCRIMDEFGRC